MSQFVANVLYTLQQQVPRLIKLARDRQSANDPTQTWELMKSSKRCDVIRLLDGTEEKDPGSIRFVCIGDTHNLTGGFEKQIPAGDVLIHAGDFTNVGESSDVIAFNDFLEKLPHKHKIVIAGNHDLSFDTSTFDSTFPRFCRGNIEEHGNAKSLLTNCTYLEDSGVEIYGIKIWGSPWTPWFYDWAFNVERGNECRSKWDLIPDDVDILITHGPPLGYGDLCEYGQRAGCLDLLRTVQVCLNKNSKKLTQFSSFILEMPAHCDAVDI